jgi:thiol:disulfide interchange protein DsbD
MPCVFPILSIKLLSVVKQSGAELNKVRAQNFSYTAGVLASFLLIGLSLSALRSAGQFVGWGFQLQSPYFVLLSCWLFFILALQLFGLYEFTWIDGNVGGKLARQGGNAGAFFTGVLAVIVASPCTAPFMGAALGFAVSQSTEVLVAIFLLMGLGLASPYLLFGIFPSWSRVLPRPGAWMQTFKVIMGIPLIFTCVWLLWLLTNLKGVPGLTLALIGLALWFFIFWFKSQRQMIPILLSGLLVVIGVVTIYRLPDAPMSVSDSSSGLAWEPFQENSVAWNGGAPLFIDFTADWCLTCKVNERLVFDREEVIDLLQSNHVRLVKADWTRQDAAITRFLGKYQRIGVPFYIVFGPGAPDGKILPEVLTPENFKREMRSVLQIKEGLK